MKSKYIFILLALVAGFGSCAKTEFDPIPLDALEKDSLKTTYTIEQLKAEFMTDRDTFSDPINKNAGLYTSDLIKSEKDVVISGYVTSSDVEGNMYKYFTLQEDRQNGQALRVSVDASGLSAIYPLGQRVWIRCNGLYIGNYGQAPQLGSLYVNTERFKVQDGKTIYRIEPGRMPLYSAKTHVVAKGLPTPNVIKADTMTIQQIKASDYRKLVNKLICIKDAYFTGFDDKNKPLTTENMIFAPSTNGVGYPQLRVIADKTGTISIASSEYAKFATKPLPESSYRGNITVIVGWYKNYIDSTPVWQLSLRSLSDLGKGFEAYLTKVNYVK